MDDPYLYPGTTVLKNHFNIRDQEELTAIERVETLDSLARLHDNSVQGNFDFAHLTEIHRRIFEPVYPFAGETRTVNLQKAEEKLAGASVQYAPFHLTRLQGEHHLKELNSADWSGLKVMSRSQDMAGFAQKIIDIWQVHPFREGNTGTTMTFMHQFAESRGFALDRELLRANAEFVRHALVVGTFGQKQHLTRILTDARQRELVREQEARTPILAPSINLSPEVPRQELQDRLAGSKAVQASTAKLEKQVGIVFANPKPVLAALRQVAETGKPDDLSIARELTQLGGLAGKSGLVTTRQERFARQNAIERQRGLRSLVETHINVVHGIRKTMAQERRAIVEQARVEVSAPSQSLMKAIQESAPLSEAHKAELRQVMATLEKRFGSDLREIRADTKPEQLAELSQKHGLDPRQMERVKSTLKVLDTGQVRVRQEARKLEQTKTAEQGRGGPIR